MLDDVTGGVSRIRTDEPHPLMVSVIGTAGWCMQELSKDSPPMEIDPLANTPRGCDLLHKAAEPLLAALWAVRKGRRLPWVWLACSLASGPWRSMS